MLLVAIWLHQTKSISKLHQAPLKIITNLKINTMKQSISLDFRVKK